MEQSLLKNNFGEWGVVGRLCACGSFFDRNVSRQIFVDLDVKGTKTSQIFVRSSCLFIPE
jgi:hypothetical protein